MRSANAFAAIILLSAATALIAKDKELSSEAEKRLAIPVSPTNLPGIDTSGFRSSIQHWCHIRDETRFIKVVPNQPSYAPEQVREIVANIILFQRANGGWPKDYDMLAVLTDEQKEAIQATRTRNDTSFDNGNIHSQVSYLARAYAEAGEPEWRDACLRGLDFIFAAQYSNGGFPQRYPKPTGFHAHITFNDGVMIGILNLLQDAASGSPQCEWLDSARREKAREAVRRGVDCILRCQIVVNGKRTGWCQQHDEKTFEPRPARSFELASICPQETTDILYFLMRLGNPPSEKTLRAMDSAVDWLRKVKLSDVRLERVKTAPIEFERHYADFDLVVVPDKNAPPIWARHYEIGTNRPIFASRDGVKRYALSEIERERRTGTAWYGGWPQELLAKEYPAWRQRMR